MAKYLLKIMAFLAVTSIVGCAVPISVAGCYRDQHTSVCGNGTNVTQQRVVVVQQPALVVQQQPQVVVVQPQSRLVVVPNQVIVVRPNHGQRLCANPLRFNGQGWVSNGYFPC